VTRIFLTCAAVLAMLFTSFAVTGSVRAQPAKAQATKPQAAKPPATPPEAPKPDAAILPYDRDLDRLAEVMGTLAFLRDLCGHKDGAAWRDRMNALMEAEGTTPERRNRLAGAYNRGFHGLQPGYHRCTPAAGLLGERLMREGAGLSRSITSRYGT
jgi:uncharacterized protein (TIGR02301 family)